MSITQKVWLNFQEVCRIYRLLSNDSRKVRLAQCMRFSECRLVSKQCASTVGGCGVLDLSRRVIKASETGRSALISGVDNSRLRCFRRRGTSRRYRCRPTSSTAYTPGMIRSAARSWDCRRSGPASSSPRSRADRDQLSTRRTLHLSR